MNKPQPSTFQKIAFWGAFACAIFMTYICFLGLLNWSRDPSDQKWAALGGCVFGAAATFKLWKDKDTNMQAWVGENVDEHIKTESAEEQRHYWKKAIHTSLMSVGIGSLLLGLLLPFARGLKPPNIYFYVGFIWMITAWRIIRAKQELAKLRYLDETGAKDE